MVLQKIEAANQMGSVVKVGLELMGPIILNPETTLRRIFQRQAWQRLFRVLWPALLKHAFATSGAVPTLGSFQAPLLSIYR